MLNAEQEVLARRRAEVLARIARAAGLALLGRDDAHTPVARSDAHTPVARSDAHTPVARSDVNAPGARSVALLAVSKTFSAQAVLALAASGQRDFGENYLQEALGKMAACRAAAPHLDLRWHFIGPIQSNKTRAIAEHFDWVHSVERIKVAERLSAQRPAQAEALQCCIQVNISEEESKSGVHPGELLALVQAMLALPRLRLRGLMAIPEPNDDREAQRIPFARLRALLHATNRHLAPSMAMDTLSMGMSADLEAAVAEGSTWVRVGSALFGSRVTPPAG